MSTSSYRISWVGRATHEADVSGMEFIFTTSETDETILKVEKVLESVPT